MLQNIHYISCNMQHNREENMTTKWLNAISVLLKTSIKLNKSLKLIIKGT